MYTFLVLIHTMLINGVGEVLQELESVYVENKAKNIFLVLSIGKCENGVKWWPESKDLE